MSTVLLCYGKDASREEDKFDGKKWIKIDINILDVI